MTAAMMAAGGAGAMFVSQVLAFVILMVVVLKLVVPGVGKIVGARSKSIQDEFARLEKESADAKARLEELKKRTAGLNQEAAQRLEKALAEAREICARALAEADEQAKGTGDRARRDMEMERDKALLELQEAAARLTIFAAAEWIKSAMDDRMQERLVDKGVARLDSVIPT